MTSPIKTRIVVTVNIQRSTLTRLAIENPFHHGHTKTRRGFAGDFGQVITELVPTILAGGALGVPARPPYCRTGEAPVAPPLHRSRHRQRMHRLLENSPAMFIALELIKAGASRSQKNHVARDGRFTRAPDSIFQSFRMVDFGSALNLRFDLGGRGPDGDPPLHSLWQQFMEQGVIAALILAPENQVQVRG